MLGRMRRLALGVSLALLFAVPQMAWAAGVFGAYVLGGIDNKDCGVLGNEGYCFSDGLTPPYPVLPGTSILPNGQLTASAGADNGFAAGYGSASLLSGSLYTYAWGNHAAFNSNPDESNGAYAQAGLTDTFTFHFAGPSADVRFLLTGTGSASETSRLSYDFGLQSGSSDYFFFPASDVPLTGGVFSVLSQAFTVVPEVPYRFDVALRYYSTVIFKVGGGEMSGSVQMQLPEGVTFDAASTIAAVPEPEACVLLAFGLLGLFARSRRRA